MVYEVFGVFLGKIIIQAIDFNGGGYRNRTGVHGFAIGQNQYIAIYNSILKIIKIRVYHFVYKHNFERVALKHMSLIDFLWF